MRIIVDTDEEKRQLLKESEYIHDLACIDSDKSNTLMHLYMNPDMIEVEHNPYWISVINRLPEKLMRVYVVIGGMKNAFYPCEYDPRANEFYIYDGKNYKVHCVTHWRPRNDGIKPQTPYKP